MAAITGTAVNSTGSPLVGAVIVFQRNLYDVHSAGGNTVFPVAVNVTTGEGGAISFALEAGEYIGTYAQNANSFRSEFGFSVPDGDSAVFNDCIVPASHG